MKNYKSFLFMFSFWVLATASANAQQIASVQFEQVGETVVVRYDITKSEGWHLFEVTLHLSTDGGKTYGNALRQVSGDVGRDVQGGNGKQITWRKAEEIENLAGNAIRFKIEALQYSTQSDPFLNEMVFIKGGIFQMGSNESNNERPVHTVTLSNFYISKYEVTQKQWRDVMGKYPHDLAFTGCDNCPVERVSWNDVQDFIKKLNTWTGKSYRLPTEAEWEYAAKGGQNYKYAGSDNIDNIAWYADNSGSKTVAVGQKSPNGYGLYDMSGNVWEWCSDVWHDNYNGAPSNGKSWSSGDKGEHYVFRGGSWSSRDNKCKVSYRGWSLAAHRNSSGGFRLAMN